MLCVLDKHTRECLAIEVGESLRNQDVILTLSRLMRLYGKPSFIQSDNGAEFSATAVMKMAASPERRASLYQAWQSLAGRICGKLQWQATRRMSESGMVRDAARGEAINRKMAAVL